MKIETVLEMLPYERPLALAGASVRITFPTRAEVLKHWDKIRPLLHSMSRCRERHSWKIDRMEPVTLIVQIQDGNEERIFGGWDLEIEYLEEIVEVVGIENVEIIEEGKPCEG